MQRQAIHRQLGEKEDKTEPSRLAVEQFIVPFPSRGEPDCPPLETGKINDLVTAAAQKQSLDPALLRAVMKQESGFKPCAVSVKGAQGLMQLMPATARELRVSNVFDPAQNVQGGASYLRKLLDRYKGDLRLALVGYNAGPGRADQRAGTMYPLETQNYIASIFSDLGIDTPDDDSVKEDLAPSDVAEETTPPQADHPDNPALAIKQEIKVPVAPSLEPQGGKPDPPKD